MTTEHSSRKTSRRQPPRQRTPEPCSRKIFPGRPSRKAGKPRLAPYALLSVFLLSGTLLLALFLFWRLITEERADQKPVRMMASLPSQDITNELFLQIQDFPGLTHCWAAYRAQANIRIGSYQASTEISGVDLSAWPLKIIKSAGKKRLGSAPLLVAGEDFFQSLSDEYGSPITRRQAQVFREKAETLDVEITLFSDAAEAAFSTGERPASYAGEAESVSGQSKTASYSTAEAAFSPQDSISAEAPSPPVYKNDPPDPGVPASFTGSFLALSDGAGLYMDAAQMRDLLKSQGFPAGLSRVCLEIQGKQNAEAAKKSLEKAGFLVEKAAL